MLTNLSRDVNAQRRPVKRVPRLFVNHKNAPHSLTRMAVVQKSMYRVALRRPENSVSRPVLWAHRETLCLPVRRLSNSFSAYMRRAEMNGTKQDEQFRV